MCLCWVAARKSTHCSFYSSSVLYTTNVLGKHIILPFLVYLNFPTEGKLHRLSLYNVHERAHLTFNHCLYLTTLLRDDREKCFHSFMCSLYRDVNLFPFCYALLWRRMRNDTTRNVRVSTPYSILCYMCRQLKSTGKKRKELSFLLKHVCIKSTRSGK